MSATSPFLRRIAASPFVAPTYIFGSFGGCILGMMHQFAHGGAQDSRVVMRSMRILLLLFILPASVRADDLADAKAEYLRARRAAARQLYDSYKQAVAAAEA